MTCWERPRIRCTAPTEQPPRKLSGKRTTATEHLERGACSAHRRGSPLPAGGVKLSGTRDRWGVGAGVRPALTLSSGDLPCPTIAVIGAGITGVTTAYALLERGFHVTVFDRHRYAAMETSFANGGQLSASNAEVWNSCRDRIQRPAWMLMRDAPLLLNPTPSWHKYSWMAEFVGPDPRTTARTRSRRRGSRSRPGAHLFEIAEREASTSTSSGAASCTSITTGRVSRRRRASTRCCARRPRASRRDAAEMSAIEPALHGDTTAASSRRPIRPATSTSSPAAWPPPASGGASSSCYDTDVNRSVASGTRGDVTISARRAMADVRDRAAPVRRRRGLCGRRQPRFAASSATGSTSIR